MRVLVVLRSSADLGAASRSRDASILSTLPVGGIPTFQLDEQFAPGRAPVADRAGTGRARVRHRAGVLAVRRARRDPRTTTPPRMPA